jgi:hypothetical protein
MPAKVYLPAQRKYRNRPGSEDGIHFDSQAEMQRYRQLKLLQAYGQISKLVADKKMLRYALKVNDLLICKYEADFQYVSDGQTVTEDVKGFRTPQYKIKKKLMKAIYGIEIQEILGA